MSKFDLSGANISDTFQHLLQIRGVDSTNTLFDGGGTQLDNFRVSGSFTTTQTVTSNNLNSQFLTFEKSKTISENQTFSGDKVSLMMGNNLTVEDGVSLTIEDDAQFIIVPSTFFIQ